MGSPREFLSRLGSSTPGRDSRAAAEAPPPARTVAGLEGADCGAEGLQRLAQPGGCRPVLAGPAAHSVPIRMRDLMARRSSMAA